MRSNYLKATFKTAVIAVTLLLGVGLGWAQQAINLTAGPATATLPDGNAVPMWGYSCGAVVSGSTASCAPSNPKATAGVWSPVIITVPTGQTLQINLTNNLLFNGNAVPTSIVIVGQVGGGLGDASRRTTMPSPTHENLGTSWPIANTGPVFVPPPQGPRVQSFATEVAAGTTASLTWTTPRPGTYLLESGTHPSIQGPMGLYGILVVTNAPANAASTGTAYPNVTYNAEIPLAFSEIDPVENNAVQTAVNTTGFSESATRGPYAPEPILSVNLISGGSGYTGTPTVTLTAAVGSQITAGSLQAVVDTDSTSPTYQQVIGINVMNGGSYTSAPSVTISGGGGSGASANVALQPATGGVATCSGGAAACYPPAVNYTPLYYLINGVAFDKTNGANSVFQAVAGLGTSTPVSTGITGSILVRMVNAGSRMHVPSIVNAQIGSANPAAPGFSLIAEDGNPLPGVPRVQSEVFMAAGKTYDVMVNAPQPVGQAPPAALPIFDRELSLSANSVGRDAGMLAYIAVNGATFPSGAGGSGAAQANPDTYNSLIAGQTLVVSDPGKGVIANDINIFGVKLVGTPTGGTVTLNSNGTFTFTAAASSGSFQYCGNGATSGAACTTVTLGAANIENGSKITCGSSTFTSNLSTTMSIKPPGILAACKDAAGYPLSVDLTTVSAVSGPGTGTLTSDSNGDGGFTLNVSAAGTYTFTFLAKNSQGTTSTQNPAAQVTLNFLPASNLQVTVMDGADKKTQITDYRWIIEEDRTFYVDPTKQTNTTAFGANGTPNVLTFGTNFHTSYMPVVAAGCTGSLSCESGQTVLGQPAVCDVGNGACRTTGAQEDIHLPSEVHLDPNKRYYISILPGDAANPFNNGYGSAPVCQFTTDGSGNQVSTPNSTCGHGMGGAPLTFAQTAVTIYTQPTPFPPAQLSVFVFEDDFPLNGEQDAGGGIDVLATNEPGLGSFQITLFDDAGGTGDATGQPTYDMFNMPLSNSLAGTIDPATNQDACPVSKNATTGFDGTQGNLGITGMIVTCPRYEADGVTLSPLAGQAVIANLYPGRYGVVATPAADRIARGEEWLQTNTLDGQKAHDSFLRIGEPSYFQEFGPAGYHVSIGFANPAIINSRLAGVCNGSDLNLTGTNCTNSVTGSVSTERMSRTPDERLYSSGSYDSFAFTQCFVSIGDPDGEDFAFTKCDANGNFTLSGLPDGTWRITVFDQWNDMLVDGLSTPVALSGGKTVHFDSSTGGLGPIAMNQWQANIYTSTFFDTNRDGVREGNEPGLTLVATNIRFRDGSFSNFNNTDLSGNAGFNEVFPLFSWYVIETDSTRYKNTGTHVVYDAGGPADGDPNCGKNGTAPCGTSAIGGNMANTYEATPIPGNLHVPGAVYCDTADCTGFSIASGPNTASMPNSTGRIDPPWVNSEGWQGFSGQNSFLEFGKTPFAVGENGGIYGHVIYASTRPFDDPRLLLQLSWEPLVPNVTINLYQEGTAADGVTPTLTLVDTTKTSSWDDWAQGFRSDGVPNMNCPGQSTSDLFYFTLYNQPEWLDAYSNGGTAVHTMPNNAQFKCYDGMHNWNQLQPAPYDGRYQFPSVTSMDPVTGKPTGTNCTICTSDPDTTDPYRFGTPMLPDGKYVVEVVVPPGYELVKEEDKNILIGDNYIAPVTQQFAGLGNIFILPDQAEVGAAYNNYNPQNSTQDLGRTTFPSHEGDTGSVETYWPCVGQSRVVPDYISLFPGSLEVSPFAGATRNLCDRKEVTLTDQTAALAKFYIFTSTHVASHFTGVITDDYTSEFDPFSPQFGEKFSPANLPISIKDWTGAEISRVYSDQWGTYNGLTYSTWEVNPPNPTGYAPTMMVTCMNDPGTGVTPDPLFNPQYSQFCYEIPFMPGQTQYMDTPVVPTSAFAGAGYNNPDCNYPANTPAVKEVDGDGVGPWVSAAGHTLTITALGDQTVQNNAYSGPQASAAPFNAKTVTRHYGFGANQGMVTIGGVSAPIGSWTDSGITVTVPNNVPLCTIQQQAQYNGVQSRCGQLVVTAANGQQSIDTVTVTVENKTPTHVTAGNTIQSAIDAAAPGDLIIVDPGVHKEMVIMWKPVRLQGVGAASSIINANAHPAGKLDPWRRSVNCLFGLSLNGQPNAGGNAFDSTGTYTCPTPTSPTASGKGPNGNTWNYFYGGPNVPAMVVDRVPLEGILGWDATVNGNLAEQLQEPSLMGAYEGAGVTVVSKGVNIPANPTDPFGSGAEAAFPAGSTLLVDTANTSVSIAGGYPTGDVNTNCHISSTNQTNPYPSNFVCNPSSIDGLSITDSSQGGGGIFVHGWAHNLQIANNRVANNAGTLSGGMSIGQGESPEAYLNPDTSTPGSCVTGAQATGLPTNTQLPYCLNLNVNIHNNSITNNSSTGDELFTGTPAGAGGASICTGADYYKFQNNWICGNLSTGDGGGVGHIGFSYNGDVEHNSFLFNQSTNPTIPTNGGGLLVMGAAPDTTLANGIECGSVTDNDCVPGLSDGTGPGLVINANLFMGNGAESGSGGGLRLQAVNGTDVARFPSAPQRWYSARVTNNIIANNVGGWDGGGVSLEDSLVVNFINNTVISNDSTASAGPLFNTLGAPLASSQSPGPTCAANCGTTSAPQPAGFVSLLNSPQLISSFTTGPITCPAGHANCTHFSNPLLANNIFWQNRSFYIGVGGLGQGTTNQQNVVALFNAFTNSQVASQPAADATTANGSGLIITGGTGACVPGVSYWDIGVRGDTGPSNHVFKMAPTYSVITDAGDYTGANNTASNPTVLSQYCNGSRVPPENGGMGYQVPPGISDATVPNPIFNLTPAATVDEGNNWVNISWGPLALTNTSNSNNTLLLGNYSPAAGSSVINLIPFGSANFTEAPNLDFFGNTRKTNNAVDAGAVEFQGNNTLPRLTSIVPNNGQRGNSVQVTLNGTNLANATAVTVSGTGVTVSGISSTATQVTATFTIAPTAPLSARTVSVTTPAGASNTVTFTVMNPPLPTITSVSPNAGVRGTSVGVTITGSNFTSTGTTVTVAGGVTVSGIVVNSSTQLTATFNIPSSSTAGAKLVRVFNPAGGSTTTLTVGTNSFTVQSATITFSGPTPVLTTAIANTNPKGPSTITLRNAAAATASLTLTSGPSLVQTAGTGTFSITGGTCANGTVVAPGGSCTIIVTYNPNGSTATSTAHVSLTDTGAASPLNSGNFNGN